MMLVVTRAGDLPPHYYDATRHVPNLGDNGELVIYTLGDRQRIVAVYQKERWYDIAPDFVQPPPPGV
jgi:hypothetical protein